MHEPEISLRQRLTAEISRNEKTGGLLRLHKSVFSRFCVCGGNVTMGLISDESYVAAERQWDHEHSGEGHASVTRHEWLLHRLKHVA
jgi:hypothetical protein